MILKDVLVNFKRVPAAIRINASIISVTFYLFNFNNSRVIFQVKKWSTT